MHGRPDEKEAPEQIIASLILYRDEGVPPGSFLEAVLANDLWQSVSKADEDNLLTLHHIVAWLHWNMPGDIWKSHERIESHLKECSRKRHYSFASRKRQAQREIAS